MTTTIILTTDQVKATLIALLAGQQTPNFVSVKNYRNNEGEVSDYVINIGASYANAKQADTEALKDAKNFESIDFGKVKAFSEDARIALLEANLNPSRQSEAQTDAYTTICPNIRLHNETGRIFVFGFKISKTVVKAIDYGRDTRQPLTIAKDKIREQLRAPKFRQYAFDKLVEIRMKGETLEFEM